MVNKISQSNTSAQTLTTTAETIVLTGNAYYYDYPNPFVGAEHSGTGQGVTISGVLAVLPGTASTFATVRCRQGSITGPEVGGASGHWTVPVTAGNNIPIPFEFLDTTRFPAQVGGGVYVITVQMTAATANSTVQPIVVDIEGA